jgi:hypothetical protein
VRVQMHLDYPGFGDDPAATYVKGWDTPWSRLPTVGEHVTVHGLAQAVVSEVVWPITDREDPVITIELATTLDEPFQPSRAQLESMGWKWATASRRRDDHTVDRTVQSWSGPGRR